MILIADSGSTKTHWALAGADGVTTSTTSGINPVHMPPAEIRTLLSAEFPWPAVRPGAVFFYGAGCIPCKHDELSALLSEFFATDRVTVASDLLGAARGLLGEHRGIACILGTGSNSAYYDGTALVQNIPPLGYILGDEGSGANLGKRLIGDLLKGLLPQELTMAFYEDYPLESAEILEAVYRSPGANRFLAGFCPFVHRHLDHPSIRALVEQAFTDFIERNLLRYPDIHSLPVSFTGSVAHYFEHPLRTVLDRHGLRAEKIERSPMDGLIRFHTRKY